MLTPIESARSPLSIGTKIRIRGHHHYNLHANFGRHTFLVTRTLKFIGLRNLSSRAENSARTVFRAEKSGLIMLEPYYLEFTMYVTC